MAPQIGPNDAPMMPNTAAASPALPESTSAIEAAVPMPQEMNGLTFGSVFLKLAAAISELKQAGGNAAIASNSPEDLRRPSPMIVLISSVGLSTDGLAGRTDQHRRRRPRSTGPGNP